MKKSILLVSHSQQLTDGLKAMIEDMSDSETVTLFSLGGTAEGELGSDPTKIVEAVNQSPEAEQILVFADLGSAVLNAELAYDMLEPDQQARYHLIDAPLVEGAFAAAITAGFSDDLSQITAEAQKAAEKGWNHE
jgi:PTS hybrid protein